MSGYVKELYVSSSSKNGYTGQLAVKIVMVGGKKVFMIHHAEDDAEPAICTRMTPPVRRAYSMFRVIHSVLSQSLERSLKIWEYMCFFDMS